MDADLLTGRDEVANAPERIGAHEDSLAGKPESDLQPVLPADDRQHDERPYRPVCERSHLQRHAEPPCNLGAVALVPVEELDDPGRLAQRGDALVQALSVDDVGQPDTVTGEHGVRGASQEVALGRPAKALLELVAETELHGNTIHVMASRNGPSNA